MSDTKPTDDPHHLKLDRKPTGEEMAAAAAGSLVEIAMTSLDQAFALVAPFLPRLRIPGGTLSVCEALAEVCANGKVGLGKMLNDRGLLEQRQGKQG